MAKRKSKDDLVRELLRVYKILEKPFSRREFDQHSKYPSRTIERRFDGWSNALDAAGLGGKFAAHKELNEEMKNFNPHEKVKEDWKEKKEKLIERAERRKVKKIQEFQAKVDVITEAITEAVAQIDPPVIDVHPVQLPPKIRNRAKKNCTLWLEFSDLQLGTLIRSEEMGGLNEHNWVIWQKKLELWKEHVIDKISQYKELYEIDQIVIAMLGDMVEGQDIFRGQVWQVELNVVDQAIEGANDTAGALVEIFMSHPEQKFHVFEVYGNHGRIGKKGENPHACSMDKVYQRFLEAMIGKTDEVKNMQYHRNEAPWFLIDTYGWHHLLLHGHQGMKGLWSNRPTVNALEKGVVRYNQMLQQQINFVHVGHFHNDWQISFNMSGSYKWIIHRDLELQYVTDGGR